MEIPWNLVAPYTIFNLFSFYQKLHIKNFQGASQGFLLFLNLFALASMLFSFAFLVYWGWHVSWGQAIAVFAITFAIQIIWFGIEAKIGLRNYYFTLSMLGFLAIPISGAFICFALP